MPSNSISPDVAYQSDNNLISVKRSYRNSFFKNSQSSKRKESNCFEGIEVSNHSGEKILLTDLWTDQVVVLKILPRLGCAMCKHEAKMLSELQPLLENLDVKLAAISFEDVDLESFISSYWKWDLFLDPQRLSYKAAGLTKVSVNELAEAFVDKGISKVVSFLKNKGVDYNLIGDLRQLGGLFIITPSGEILYEFKPTKYAVFPCLKELYSIVGGDPDDVETDLPIDCIYTKKSLSKSIELKQLVF